MKFCGRLTTGPIVWLILVIVCRAAQPPAITYAVTVPSSTGAIAGDAKGNVYLANSTVTGLPTPSAPHPSQDSSWGWTSCLVKYDSQGQLLFATYFSGIAWSIALDQGGNPFVAVELLPSTQQQLAVVKLDAAGSAASLIPILGCSCVLPSAHIAVFGADIYLAGVAQSAFPATPGAFQTVPRAPQLTTAFVVKYNLEIEPVGPPPLFVAAGVVSSAEAEPE